MRSPKVSKKAKCHLDLALALPLALDLDQQHMLTSLAAGKNSEPQANTGYQILSDMEEA